MEFKSVGSIFDGLKGAVREIKEGAIEVLDEKLRIEIFCRDAELKSILDTIWRAAHTGNPGDGKVFVSPLARVVGIRTGEEGPEVLLCGYPDDNPHG